MDVAAALNQLVAFQEAVMTAAGDPAIAYAYPEQYSSFPYWFNRVATMTPESQAGTVKKIRVVVQSWCVIGHGTQGYAGSLATRLQTIIVPSYIEYVLPRWNLETTPGKRDSSVPEGLMDRIVWRPAQVFARAAFLDWNPVGALFEIELPFTVKV